jgi:hypothetical protein
MGQPLLLAAATHHRRDFCTSFTCTQLGTPKGTPTDGSMIGEGVPLRSLSGRLVSPGLVG